ncbi:MAG TPA: adenylate/guanylate cyclase domain-containing protein [Candidatus Limnocylindrales bacterium]|nr:adenylate/guanylate cyclase domain-containing protein [Candidatus Limnocylindrales bacterium]
MPPRPGTPSVSPALVSAINRFPDDNPNPVMRVDADGTVSYANPASAAVLRGLGAAVGERVPDDQLARLVAAGEVRESVDLVVDSRTWSVWPVPIRDLGFLNVYGRDVTAERAIRKFPDQNPNPVLRFEADGTLVYANGASAGLVAGLGLAVGTMLPAPLLASLRACADAGDRGTVELEAGDRAYRLLAVDVPEFRFVNVYGTDITAEREQARLALENERLLLNILPEPIARRLREGEPLIADRFEDVTLMFADIAEFTRLSASMSADELVRVLNDVFSVFDGLVDRHGLEKVKTIGDAYMVVGGLPEWSADHTARVAAMAVDLADSIARIESARRLGIAFRIGIHCGPVVAGVIGTRKFIYDIWGDTVNTASRMESSGVPGRIQVTDRVRDRLVERFRFESRGLIDIKGKGPMPTWFLDGAIA